MNEIPAIVTQLYASQAKSVGGREGHITTEDGVLSLEMTQAKYLGGRERAGASNPEQLFAAGYATCFANTISHMARQAKVPLDLTTVSVDAHVQMGATATNQGQLAVQLRVSLPGIEPATAARLVAQAHEVCPYSRAVSGNIAVDITTTTDSAQ